MLSRMLEKVRESLQKRRQWSAADDPVLFRPFSCQAIQDPKFLRISGKPAAQLATQLSGQVFLVHVGNFQSPVTDTYIENLLAD